MGEATSNILERKAAVGRENHQAHAMTVPKALRLTSAKVAEEMFDLPMASLSISIDVVANENLPEAMPAENLLLLLDGAGGRTGIAMLDAAMVGGLVQQQTMGTVLPDFDTERRMTETDASLVAGFIEAYMQRLAQTIEEQAQSDRFDGYQFAAMAEDQRLALMALEEPEYHRYSMTFDIARGARQGQLVFLLPAAAKAEQLSLDAAENGEAAPSGPDMSQIALGLQAELRIVLCKLRLPLGKIETLQPGDILELPPQSFPNVQVYAIDGRCVGKGTLGQKDGRRAVQMVHEPKPDMTPMRRESDKANLAEGLDGADMGAMPGMAGNVPALPPADDMLALPEDIGPVPDLTMPDTDAMDGLGTLEDLPDLGALPDLDVAGAEGMPDPGASEDAVSVPGADMPDLDALPELDALPDLADLPDLAELPDLKSA